MHKHIDPLFSQKDNPIDATMPQEDVANVGWWGTREVVPNIRTAQERRSLGVLERSPYQDEAMSPLVRSVYNCELRRWMEDAVMTELCMIKI